MKFTVATLDDAEFPYEKTFRNIEFVAKVKSEMSLLTNRFFECGSMMWQYDRTKHKVLLGSKLSKGYMLETVHPKVVTGISTTDSPIYSFNHDDHNGIALDLGVVKGDGIVTRYCYYDEIHITDDGMIYIDLDEEYNLPYKLLDEVVPLRHYKYNVKTKKIKLSGFVHWVIKALKLREDKKAVQKGLKILSTVHKTAYVYKATTDFTDLALWVYTASNSTSCMHSNLLVPVPSRKFRYTAVDKDWNKVWLHPFKGYENGGNELYLASYLSPDEIDGKTFTPDEYPFIGRAFGKDGEFVRAYGIENTAEILEKAGIERVRFIPFTVRAYKILNRDEYQSPYLDSETIDPVCYGIVLHSGAENCIDRVDEDGLTYALVECINASWDKNEGRFMERTKYRYAINTTTFTLYSDDEYDTITCGVSGGNVEICDTAFVDEVGKLVSSDYCDWDYRLNKWVLNAKGRRKAGMKPDPFAVCSDEYIPPEEHEE